MVHDQPRANDLGGRTGMTLTHVGVPADSPGWNMALDELATYATSIDGR